MDIRIASSVNPQRHSRAGHFGTVSCMFGIIVYVYLYIMDMLKAGMYLKPVGALKMSCDLTDHS